MWDPRFPLWVRLLSLYHVLLPVLLIWTLRRMEFDQRGWILQSAIAIVVLAVSRLVESGANINFVCTDPIFKRSWGPPPVHLAVIAGSLIGIIYWPTHAVISRLLPPLQGGPCGKDRC